MATTTEKKEKTVKVRIPRLRDEDGDVYVGVNGKGYLIQRGVETEVPESVAEVLRHRDEALEQAYLFKKKAKG